MKKLFFSFATVMLLVGFQACKQKAAEDTTTTGADTTTVVTEPAVAPVAAANDSDTGRIPTPPPDPIKK